MNSGNYYVNGTINQNGGYVEAGGKATHRTNGGTEVSIGGNVNRSQPFKGKGQNGGEVKIGVTKTF